MRVIYIFMSNMLSFALLLLLASSTNAHSTGDLHSHQFDGYTIAFAAAITAASIVLLARWCYVKNQNNN